MLTVKRGATISTIFFLNWFCKQSYSSIVENTLLKFISLPLIIMVHKIIIILRDYKIPTTSQLKFYLEVYLGFSLTHGEGGG